MLESFVFRRDDPESFREDERTSASSVTSAGAPFRVSFILADPPTPSRLFVSWPDGPKRGMACHLVAAHGGLVLLRLDSVVLDSTEKHPTTYKAVIHDYFVYYIPAGPDPSRSPPPPERRPSLKRLPAYAEYSSIVDKPVLFPFEAQSVGLCRRGEEEEFALAYLGIHRTGKSAEAKLWVLRSTVAGGGDGDSSAAGSETEKWEIKSLPIQYQAEEFNELFYWLAHATIPFKNSLCWVKVNYYCGILFYDDVFGDTPKISYHRLPLDSFPRFPPPRKPRKELYRSLCVTGDGHQLRFVDVARDDGEGIGQMKPCEECYIAI